MHPDILENYVDKVYGYAVNHTYTKEEAQELAQEILLTAVRALPKLKNDDRFEPWLWGIAGNVTKAFRRLMGKQRAMYFYDAPDIPYEDEHDDETEEIYDLLRTKIAMLSAAYRDMIILYYYDGLSTKQISERLKVPEGTVTWRLSQARKKLKKECDYFMNATALHPVRLKIDIYGSGNYGRNIPFPNVFINDALSQNILYCCYEQPHTVEELAKLCGVPAYYVEERIENLIKRNAVQQPASGKYQTDFIIWSDQYGIYCENNAEPALLPIADRVIDALKALAKDAYAIDLYKAGKSEEELFYLFGVMAFDYLNQHYCSLPCPEIQPNYDGFCWRYIASTETGSHHRIQIGRQHSGNQGSRGTCSHTTYKFAGFQLRPMMTSDQINVCEDLLTKGTTQDQLSAADAIQDGYILRKESGELFVTVPAFTKEQYAAFCDLVEQHFAVLMPDYSKIVEDFTAGYRKLFPKHLKEDAERMNYGVFFGLYECFVVYGQKIGLIAAPAPSSVCDVLIQHH